MSGGADSSSPLPPEREGKTADAQTWNYTKRKPPAPPTLRKGRQSKRQDSPDKDGAGATQDPDRYKLVRCRTEPFPIESMSQLSMENSERGELDSEVQGNPVLMDDIPSTRAKTPSRRLSADIRGAVSGEPELELSPDSNSSCDTHTWRELPSPVTPLCQAGPPIPHLPTLGPSALGYTPTTLGATPPFPFRDSYAMGASTRPSSSEGVLTCSSGRRGSSPAALEGRGAYELLSAQEKVDARDQRMCFPKGLHLGPGGLSLVDNSGDERSNSYGEVGRGEYCPLLPWGNLSDLVRRPEQNPPLAIVPSYRHLSLELREVASPQALPIEDPPRFSASCDWQGSPCEAPSDHLPAHPLPSPLGTSLHKVSSFSLQDVLMSEHGWEWDRGGGEGEKGGGGGGGGEGGGGGADSTPNVDKIVSQDSRIENKRGAPEEWEELCALVEAEGKRAKGGGGEERMEEEEEEKSSLEKALAELRKVVPDCVQLDIPLLLKKVVQCVEGIHKIESE